MHRSYASRDSVLYTAYADVTYDVILHFLVSLEFCMLGRRTFRDLLFSEVSHTCL
jgi:hypothetical protein